LRQVYCFALGCEGVTGAGALAGTRFNSATIGGRIAVQAGLGEAVSGSHLGESELRSDASGVGRCTKGAHRTKHRWKCEAQNQQNDRDDYRQLDQTEAVFKFLSSGFHCTSMWPAYQSSRMYHHCSFVDVEIRNPSSYFGSPRAKFVRIHLGLSNIHAAGFSFKSDHCRVLLLNNVTDGYDGR